MLLRMAHRGYSDEGSLPLGNPGLVASQFQIASSGPRYGLLFQDVYPD